jgi:23S rRNA (uracil1939-C5)-methyltransferase
MPKPSETIFFKIEHLDPMGQGVSKVGNKVTFIPLTLPREEGEATIVCSSKGVHFAQLKNLEIRSQLRIQPDCPHYEHCGGCHYLHCEYSDEIDFKSNSLQRMLEKCPLGGTRT